MKILKLALFFLGTLCGIINDNVNEPSNPEPKNMDIMLPKGIMDPVVIRTNNIVRKVYSEVSPIKVYSATGEIIQARQKRFGKSQIPDPIPFIRKKKTNPPNHIYFRNYKLRPSYYDPNARKLKKTTSKILDKETKNDKITEQSVVSNIAQTNESLEPFVVPAQKVNQVTNLQGEHFEEQQKQAERRLNLINPKQIHKSRMAIDSTSFDEVQSNAVIKEPLQVLHIDPNELSQASLNAQSTNENLQKIFTSTAEYEYEHDMASKIHRDHLCVAYNHLKNLEDQMRDAVVEAAAPNSKLMSPRVLKLIVNFLVHIDYLEKTLIGQAPTTPPKLYDYFTDEEISLSQLNELLQPGETLESLHEQDFKEISDDPRANLPGDEEYERMPDRFARTSAKVTRQLKRFSQTNSRDANIPLSNIRPQRKANQSLPSPTYAGTIVIPQSSSGPLKLILPQDIRSSHVTNFLLVVESIKGFYSSLFLMIPPQTDLSNKDDVNLKRALDLYHQLQLFSQTFQNSTATFDQDLVILRTQMKAISIGLHNALSFYGYETDYNEIKCQTDPLCANQITDFKAAVETQARMFSSRVDDAIILIDECRADMTRMGQLVADIALPAQNESLFNPDFINTLNYSNQKLPIILEMQPTINTHLKDLEAVFQLLKSQQIEMDKIFSKAHEDIDKIEKKGAFIWQTIGLALIFIPFLL